MNGVESLPRDRDLMVNEPGETPGAHGGTEAVQRDERHGDPSEAAASRSVPASPRSRLTDIADQTVIRTGGEQPEGDVTAALAAAAPADVDAPADPGPAPPHGEAVSDEEAAQVQARRRRFLAELGEFRRSRVLVPVGALPGPNAEEAPLTVDMGGVRWILAFTGEAALARYVVARGEDGRAWPYRSVWGAALLDAAVPAVAESGVPCGVLVNAADGAHGLVLPPVAQVVPEAVAVNGPEHRMDGEENR